MAYTTVLEVRENTTKRKDYFTGVTGTDITVPDNYTQNFIEVKKNGVALATNAYSFIPPYTLRLVSPAVSTDYFEISRGILLTDAEITGLITDADNLINSKLSQAYALPFSSTPPLISTLSKRLAQAYIIRRLNNHSAYNVHPSELEFAFKEIEDVCHILDILIEGIKLQLVDASYVVIPRIEDYKDTTIYVGMDDSTEEV